MKRIALCFSIMLCVIGLNSLTSDLYSSLADSGQTAPARSGEVPPGQNLDGFYLGSSNGEYGQLAWFIQINSNGQAGYLYDPPGLKKISSVELRPSGEISFHTDKVTGAVAYDFSGRITSAGIDGTFKGFEPPSSQIIEETKVSLQKLDAKILDLPQAAGIYGQYSNMVYNQQSGNLNGLELIIIPGDHGPFGIFNTSDLGLTRYIMLNTKYAAGKFSFEVNTQIGRSRYICSVLPGKISLRNAGNLEAKPIIITKRKTLPGFFTKQNVL